MEKLEVVSPLGCEAVSLARAVPRLSDLDGKTIGELWNGVFKGDQTFPVIRRLLEQRFPRLKIIPFTEFPHAPGSDDLPARLRAAGADRIAVRAGASHAAPAPESEGAGGAGAPKLDLGVEGIVHGESLSDVPPPATSSAASEPAPPPPEPLLQSAAASETPVDPIGQLERNPPIAEPALDEDGIRAPGQSGDPADPLLALGVGPDHNGPHHRVADPGGDKRGGMQRKGRNGVDLGQRRAAMEMRIDGDEPVEPGREEACELRRGHRLAGLEAAILTHVGEVRADEANRAGPEVARRGDVLSRQVGLGAVRGDPHRACAQRISPPTRRSLRTCSST